MTSAKLRWEEAGPQLSHGYSGSVIVVELYNPHDGIWAWDITAIMMSIDGEASTREAARAAAEAAWGEWLAQAGLAPRFT